MFSLDLWMGCVVGLWVYQTLGSLPDPDAVAARAQRAGMRWLKPQFPSYLSSFGLPSFHPSLDWAVCADAGFHGMPQAYENLNAQSLTPHQCVEGGRVQSR